MPTKQKETAAGKEKRGVSPMGSSTTTHAERRRSLRPSTPPGPGSTLAKDHGKAPATTSSAAGESQKNVPNYLRPTMSMSSKPDAVKHTVKKNAHDDSHKPTPAVVRRRSFDRPVPASQVHKAMQSSGTRGERVPSPFSPKQSATVTRPASSTERISKVVKAVKSQPPLLKTKSMPKTSSASSSSGVKKEVKTSNLKKATPAKEEQQPVHAPNTVEPEAEDHESLDLNVEEELAKLESPADLPPEIHFAEDKEQVDEESHSPEENFDANEEKLNASDITISEDHQDEHEQEHTPEPVAETTESVEVSNEETQIIHHSQHTDVSDQQSNQAVNEAPAVDETKEEETEKEKETEKDTEEAIMPVKLTVKTNPDEKDEVADAEDQGQQNSEVGEEIQKSKEEDSTEKEHKADEVEKPANSEAQNVVHKRQVGGPRTKKESPAYNDVIEETASKLVEKRVNKVRALAGAFETVISLQQPDSS
uniref:Calmodulin-binding domain-containing protein n=1 Tax=Kalanchoe fedtschenkoi TaxID=63787 RepID=A0A7N0V5E8_KALFE